MNAEFVALSSIVIIERHYLARDNEKTGLAVAFGSAAEENLYYAFYCLMCGCQVIAERDYISFVKEDEDDEQI